MPILGIQKSVVCKKRRFTNTCILKIYVRLPQVINSIENALVVFETGIPSTSTSTSTSTYLSNQIEWIQKRALKIIFPSLCYEDALKKSGLILLCQRREDACITFLKRSYSSSDLLRSLVPRVVHIRPYALRTGESVSVPASSRTQIWKFLHHQIPESRLK